MADFYRSLGTSTQGDPRFADAVAVTALVKFPAYLCDPEQSRGVLSRGDTRHVPTTYAKRSLAISGRRRHDDRDALCREIFAHVSSHRRLRAVAEILFNTIRCTLILKGYDTERAGGFEPLRFVPKYNVIVFGLITSRPAARSKDEPSGARRTASW